MILIYLSIPLGAPSSDRRYKLTLHARHGPRGPTLENPGSATQALTLSRLNPFFSCLSFL